MKHRKPSVVLALELMKNCPADENTTVFDRAREIIESRIENLYTDVMGGIASEEKPLDNNISRDQAEKYNKIVDKTREFINFCYNNDKNPFLYKEVKQPNHCCFLFFSCSYTSPNCFDDKLMTDQSALKQRYNSFLLEIKEITFGERQTCNNPIHMAE